ncbi:MAG TPA: hypothetical protein VL024_00660 [Castellaniella sp.]|nr:hypothetical protein [Castellaniella sp.]
MIKHTDATPERRMWADVALLAIMDHAKRIQAAERGSKYARMDSNQPSIRIGDTSDEIDFAYRYFSSPDWREVASCAGINSDPDQAVRACLLGPKELRRLTRQNGIEAGDDE